MGLNYQTEHHLFPFCPRNKLSRLTPHVLAACEQAGLPYTEVSFVETNRFLLRTMGSATRALQASTP
jgi:fatty acid desaturase